MTKSKQKTVLITGASGFLGTALVEHFQQAGWQVIALVRGANKYHGKPSLKYIEFDLSKPFDDHIFYGADYMVHTAYIKNDTKHSDAFKLNVDGSKRLLLASRKHKLKRNLFISSMSAHSGAQSVYGKQKLAVESLFKGVDCTVIRSGVIMGNGGIVGQMTSFMRSKHTVPLIGGGKQPLQIVAVYDLVRVIDTIFSKNKLGTFTIATPEVYTYKEFYTALRNHLNTPVIFVPIPFALLLGIIKLTNILHLPISVNEDNALGLKHLRSAKTSDDLRTLNIKLDNLEQALGKLEI